MAEKGCIRKIEIKYSYDRLATRKLSQVYNQLLPDGLYKLFETIGEACEISSHLRTGFIGATERRENH